MHSSNDNMEMPCDCHTVCWVSTVGSGLNRRERSPAPHFDRSDSVTPTNELIDEESVTPRSVSPPLSLNSPPHHSLSLSPSLSCVQKEGVKDAGLTLAGNNMPCS